MRSAVELPRCTCSTPSRSGGTSSPSLLQRLVVRGAGTYDHLRLRRATARFARRGYFSGSRDRPLGDRGASSPRITHYTTSFSTLLERTCTLTALGPTAAKRFIKAFRKQLWAEVPRVSFAGT